MKHIVSDIQSKEFNKPDVITLVLGNPENIKDPAHRAMAKRECDAMIEWCLKNNVSVKWHNHSLDETMTQIFTPESVETNTLKAAFN